MSRCSCANFRPTAFYLLVVVLLAFSLQVRSIFHFVGLQIVSVADLSPKLHLAEMRDVFGFAVSHSLVNFVRMSSIVWDSIPVDKVRKSVEGVVNAGVEPVFTFLL